MTRPARRNIDRRRRAEIGAAKRTRTRAEIIATALELFGRPHGRNTRIEDICARARISRGTFYNYFEGIDQLLEALSDALTRDFDSAVHAAFASLDGAAERTCAALRYYLHAAVVDPRWGWALVNSSVGTLLYGENITGNARTTIQEGIDSGEFRLSSAELGRDLVLGASISATVTLLGGAAPRDYPEQVARHLLLALGTSPQLAARITARPMTSLPALAIGSAFFRGGLGGAGHAGGAQPPMPGPRRKSSALSRRAGDGSRVSGRSRARGATAA